MIKDLLLDVDSSPDRPDNPVSDCLKSRASMPEEAEPQPIEPRQAVNAQPLAGPGSEGLDSAQLALRLSAQTDLAGVRTVVRLTRTYFLDAWPTRMHDLNSGASASETVLTSQIYDQSLSIVRMFSADIELVEEFGLGIIEAGSVPLVSQTMRIVEDWIALSERAWPGTTRKTVVGTPSLLALRLLAVWGAKAADDDSHRCLATLLGTPLSSVEFNGRPSHLPVVDRRDLFWPAAMLDYADLGVHYLRDEPWTNARVQPFFASLDDYLAGLSVFLFVAALIYGARHSTAGWPMYPGFKLIPKASHAIQRFMARVATNSDAVEALARLVPETPEEFQANWGERVGSLNAASLGGRYDINIDWRRIPGRFEDLAGRSPDD